MIGVKLATAALLGLTVATTLAQAPPIAPSSLDSRARLDSPADARPGFEPGAPQSVRPSNITAGDTRSSIAPALPIPPVPDNAGPREFLRAAHDALAAGHTGEAQAALEQAETRVLSREVSPDQAAVPSDNPMVSRIRDALEALGNGDRARAIQAVDTALAS